jgi:hypothetical protein
VRAEQQGPGHLCRMHRGVCVVMASVM